MDDGTTTLNMAVTCNTGHRITTLCAANAKTITIDPDNDSMWLFLAEIKMKLPFDSCEQDDPEDSSNTNYGKFTCGGGKVTKATYSDSACSNAVGAEESITTGKTMVQASPGDGTMVLGRFECGNGWFELYSSSVFEAATSGLKRTTTYTYVKPTDLTQDGDQIKHNGNVVTPESNKALQPVLQYPDDPAYASKETSAASFMFVAFGILASLFAL